MQQVKLLSHSSSAVSCEGLFEGYTSLNCPFTAFYHPATEALVFRISLPKLLISVEAKEVLQCSSRSPAGAQEPFFQSLILTLPD